MSKSFLGRNRCRCIQLSSLTAMIALGAVATSTPAAIFQWDGGGANTNWNTAANWVGSAPSSSDQNDLEFGTVALQAPGNLTANNNITSDFNLNSITFGGTANASFNLIGSSLDFKKDGSVQPSINQNSNLAHSIANSLKVSGDNFTLGGNGTGLVTISGAISGGKPLIKSGASTYLITGNNTSLDAATTINGGTLIVGHASALDSSGTITVNNTGILAINSGITFTRAVTFNSGSTLGGKGTYNPSSTFTVGNNVTLAPGINDIGTLAMSKSTTFAAGSFFAVGVGAGAANNDRLNVTGTLNTGAANTLALNMSGADQGKYTLASATTSLSIGSNTAANGGFGTVTGLDSVYRLNTTATAIELIHKATMAIDAASPSQMITGGTIAISGHVANIAPTNSDALTYTLSGSTGVSGLPVGTLNRTAGDANAAAGATYNASFTSTTVGANLVTVTATGTNAATVTNSPQSADVTVNVLAHSNAAFDNVSGAHDSFQLTNSGDDLTIDFGQVVQGAGGGSLSSFFDILAQVDVAGFTAGLDLDSLVNSGDTLALAVSGASTFTNKAAGGSEAYTLTFDTTTVGAFTATYTFKHSDQDLPGATAANSELLTLVVTGEIIPIPEPTTLGLLAPLALAGLRRRCAGI